MDIGDIAAKMREVLGRAGGLDKSVKFDFGDDGCIYASGTDAVSEDRNADCTISIARDDFLAMADGKLDPQIAFMSGKLKISGDMSVAMGLQNLFNSM